MPNFKTGFPRQPDYDDDQRALLSRLVRLEAALSAAQTRSATASQATTATSTTTVINNTTTVVGGTGFISLSLPSWLSAGATIQTPPGGTLSATDPGQTANKVLAGPTSGGTATALFRSLVNADFPTSGVTAGTYTAATVTVNAQGIVTFATASTLAGGTGITALNLLTAAGLTIVAGANITITSAGTSITVAASLTAASGGTGSVSAGWWNTYQNLTPPQTADTFWVNQGLANTAASLTPVLDSTGRTAGLYLLDPPDGNVGTNPGQLRMRLTAAPASATWTATMAFEPGWRSTQYPMMGFILSNTAATVGNLYLTFHLLQDSASLKYEITNYTATGTFGVPTVPFSELRPLITPLSWQRIRQSTGTISFEFSADARNWLWLTGWTTGTYVTSVQQIGYFVNSRSSIAGRSAAMTLWHWRVDQQ